MQEYRVAKCQSNDPPPIHQGASISCKLEYNGKTACLTESPKKSDPKLYNIVLKPQLCNKGHQDHIRFSDSIHYFNRYKILLDQSVFYKKSHFLINCHHYLICTIPTMSRSAKRRSPIRKVSFNSKPKPIQERRSRVLDSQDPRLRLATTQRAVFDWFEESPYNGGDVYSPQWQCRLTKW